MLCDGTRSRTSFGKGYEKHQMIQAHIAESRIELRQARVLTPRAAWKLGRVLEGAYARCLSRESNNPNHDFFAFVVDQLKACAQRFAV